MLKLSLIKINAIRWLGAAIIYYASLYKVVPMATSKLRTYFTQARDFENFVKMKTEKLQLRESKISMDIEAQAHKSSS